MLDKLKAAFRAIFHVRVALQMCALCDHLHDGIGRAGELLHDKCYADSFDFYSSATLFNFTHAHPPKAHKTHGPPAAQVISRRQPAYDSISRFRILRTRFKCKYCYPKIDESGQVFPAQRLTYSTALRRVRKGLAHVFGSAAAAAGCAMHGFRAGGVVDALLRGVPTAAIKAQGHWALDSNCMEKHARLSIEDRMMYF